MSTGEVHGPSSPAASHRGAPSPDASAAAAAGAAVAGGPARAWRPRRTEAGERGHEVHGRLQLPAARVGNEEDDREESAGGEERRKN
jgi:hypothetical protein